MVDKVPADKCCEVLDGDLTHEKWDENEIKILLIVMMPRFCYNLGVITKCYEG